MGQPTHVPSLSRRARLVLALLLAATGVAFTSIQRPPVARSDPNSQPPSIVLILTDDQRWDTLAAMPNVQNLLIAHGVDFRQAFVVNPLCCPSRTSILTGRYSHSTGVYTNSAPNGGFELFTSTGQDQSTIATWLHNVGYQTALIGKYLNGYQTYTNGTYVPPGWDQWFAFDQNGGGSYYDYAISDNGTIRSYGDGRQDYSTDVLARRAASFIRTAAGPLFLYFATSAPHAPYTPQPRDASAFQTLAPSRPPSYNEPDVADKPTWIRDRPQLGPWQQRNLDRFRRNQYRTLLPVDRAVGRIVGALQATGRLEHTMIVFTSDNGFMWGEHRLKGKIPPYEEGIRVPMVIRYDPLTASPREDWSLALNIDLAPTFADLAGVIPPSVDGSSLVPLLGNPQAQWRSDFLVEHLEDWPRIPTYCAVRNQQYMYIDYQYQEGQHEEELYDLTVDPYELDNRATDPTYAAIRDQLRSRLQQLCNPTPPGFTFGP